MTRYVIIGDGAAGTTAAYYIRRADPSATIQIYSDDPNPAYYRAALTNYLIGELREAQLFAVPPDFYREHKVERILARVVNADTQKARLTLTDGRQVGYDQLLIAAGASPNPPSFPGSELAGVMTMRTLQDARTVMDAVRAGQLRRAVVVGGGPLGIEWVQGLLRYNIHVTYLLRGDMFFERALDRTGSDLVISRLRAEGVDVRTNEEIAEAIGGRDGKLRAIRLKNSGQTIECQLVGAAIGIQANVRFLEDSGVKLARDEKRGTLLGIPVDNHMRTNIPNVYAGGDILHHTLGLWEPARLQGRVAGQNMAGGSEIHELGAHYNATRLYDLDFSSVGELNEKTGDRVIIDFPRGSGRIAYRKVILRNGKLVGALMLGQRKERVRKYGLQFKRLIDANADVSSVADRLLDPTFDLAAWMDSLDLQGQIASARSLIISEAAPSMADMRKGSQAEEAGTAAAKPLDLPAGILHQNGSTITLQRLTHIGRHPENEVILTDPLSSARHAQIQWQSIAFVLSDLGSRNGTFINDTRITDPRALQTGDVIRIGNVHLQFELPVEVKQVSGPSGIPEEVAVADLPPDAVLGVIEIASRKIEVRSVAINIGRDPNAEISTDDQAVSYLHAQISRHGNELYLRDLGSRNGTYVNESMVTIPHLLTNGDVVRVGYTKMTFHAQGQAAAVKKPDTPAPGSLSATPAPLGIRLVVHNGPTVGLSFALEKSPIHLGRDPEGQVALRDQTVSWQHARLDQRGPNWVVTDLKSSNGTRINNRKLDPLVETPLTPDDELRLGDVILKVEGATAPSPAVNPTGEMPIPKPAEAQQPTPAPTPSPVRPPTQVIAPMAAPAPKPSVSAAPAPTGTARLIAESGTLAGQSLELTPPITTFGRHPKNQLILSDPSISGYHARFEQRDSNWFVTDLKSSNGTRINGERILPETPTQINHGDKLTLGTVPFVFEAPLAPIPAPSFKGTMLMEPIVEEEDATKSVPDSFPTRLSIITGARIGVTIKLARLPITLGRVTVPEVEGLDDAMVSRRHLEILLTPEGEVAVRDLGSANGTRLNADKLVPNQVTPLHPGDELRLGNTVLKAE